ncbi:hypothetical protein [Bernardetia sp. MNP-M8]|uniref:hypothetical protein n=1 Tax=Bernardetia sp. MNP-M8 TaxID=3127470 RepID=UPI0030CFBB24
MMNLDTVKLRLIQQIMNLESQSFLEKIESQVRTFVSIKNEEKESFWNAVRPIKKTPSIEEMIILQNHKSINKERFYNKVSQLQLEEPLEELLEMLKK